MLVHGTPKIHKVNPSRLLSLLDFKCWQVMFISLMFLEGIPLWHKNLVSYLKNQADGVFYKITQSINNFDAFSPYQLSGLALLELLSSFITCLLLFVGHYPFQNVKVSFFLVMSTTICPTITFKFNNQTPRPRGGHCLIKFKTICIQNKTNTF